MLDTFNFVASGVSIYRVLALEIEIYRLPGNQKIKHFISNLFKKKEIILIRKW